MAYTDESITYLIRYRDENPDLTWEEIREHWNNTFIDGGTKTLNALRKLYKRYRYEDLSEDSMITNLKTTRKAQDTVLKLRKENKVILEQQIDLEGVLQGISGTLKTLAVKKVKVPKPPKRSKKKRNMVIEPLVSDLHYGLKTKTYDLSVLRERLKQYTEVLLRDKDRYSISYNIDKFIILLNGDIIQSATMHKDSGKSCHLTNAEQLSAAIESLYEDLILPIALTGIPVEIIGTAGNHDREQSDRFTVDPGNNYYTHTIYHSLKGFCKAVGLKNVKWTIPAKAYHVYQVYGHNFLVEHGDLIGNTTNKTLESHLLKRGNQEGKILKGMRFGHYHNDVSGSLGRYIGNGSTVSDDHYGDGLGYVSRPSQTINYYVENDSRNTSFYHSFPVNLG